MSPELFNSTLLELKEAVYSIIPYGLAVFGIYFSSKIGVKIFKTLSK